MQTTVYTLSVHIRVILVFAFRIILKTQEKTVFVSWAQKFECKKNRRYPYLFVDQFHLLLDFLDVLRYEGHYVLLVVERRQSTVGALALAESAADLVRIDPQGQLDRQRQVLVSDARRVSRALDRRVSSIVPIDADATISLTLGRNFKITKLLLFLLSCQRNVLFFK